MEPGTLRSQAPSRRRVQGAVLLRLDATDRRLLHAALTEPLSCVWQPGYRRDREATYRITLPATATHLGKRERAVFDWHNFARYRLMQTVAEAPCLVPAQRCRDIVQWARTIAEVRDCIVVANLGMVHALAGRFMRRNEDRDDWVAQLLPSLLCAVERFDCHRGVKFVSFAYLGIQRAAWYWRNKTDRRAARETGLLDELCAAAPGPPADAVLDAEHILSHPVLTLRERRVLIHRYGLRGRPPLTLAEVAELLGILSKERVRQIQAAAETKLRSVFAP